MLIRAAHTSAKSPGALKDLCLSMSSRNEQYGHLGCTDNRNSAIAVGINWPHTGCVRPGVRYRLLSVICIFLSVVFIRR